MTEVQSLQYMPTTMGRRFYAGWIHVAVAALAMVATLPGRSQGLGMITEPLLADMHVSHVSFGQMNFAATVIGGAFCLACGPLIDWLGARIVLTLVSAALGATVLWMSRVHSAAELVVALTLTRGFGQSALSVVSLTIVGKWFVKRLPTAMAVYAILLSIGFCIAFPTVGAAAAHSGWRPVWWWIGFLLLIGMTPIAWLLVRRTPESIGLHADGESESVATEVASPAEGFTLAAALASPAFWAFALSAAAFGLVSTGLMLFNEAVLSEHGIDASTIRAVMGVIVLAGLFANFGGGWLAERWPLGRLMACGMFLLAASLFALPAAHGRGAAYAYAAAMGLSAGVVTVVFFVCWGKVFGRRHLGAIQGAAQLMTVLSSAAGPWLLAASMERWHSSTSLLFWLAPGVAGLGIFCWFVPLPKQLD